jgi:hypothetical protein
MILESIEIRISSTHSLYKSRTNIDDVNSPGDPAAMMMISAFLVIPARSCVAELQLVTVAPAFTSMSVIGLPTILDLPITTTSAHPTSI